MITFSEIEIKNKERKTMQAMINHSPLRILITLNTQSASNTYRHALTEVYLHIPYLTVYINVAHRAQLHALHQKLKVKRRQPLLMPRVGSRE